jgi:predicted TIM-barrel fold metal-dependent hydrolase
MAMGQADFDKAALDRPLAVVSCDGHAGPRLVEDLRPYCPRTYLSEFDDYVVQNGEMKKAMAKGGGLMGSPVDEEGNVDPRGVRLAEAMAMINTTTGHYDIAQRLRDMDMDGVCAEVVFPSSHNGESEPFIMSDQMLDPINGNVELFGVGLRIYAEWLVDACKQADGRLVGLITPPLWDIEASIETVKWAHAKGLRGVFLLMPRRGVARYDRPEWEPFWAVCEDLGMNLYTHSGAPGDEDIGMVRGPAIIAVAEIEIGGWPARKPAHQLIFSGVFERHPKLKLIFTEQNFDWWVSSAREFDSVYLGHRQQFKPVIKRKPSEYMADNCFIGASFLAPFEAEDAVAHGYTGNVLWGRDYGHIEGTFVVPGAADPATNLTRLSMRYALANVPPADIRKMVSENAIDFMGLDADKMAAISARIGCPSLTELTTPIQAIPENGGILAFREVGAWY